MDNNQNKENNKRAKETQINNIKYLIFAETCSLILSGSLIIIIHIYTLPVIIGLIVLSHAFDYGILYGAKYYDKINSHKDKRG